MQTNIIHYVLLYILPYTYVCLFNFRSETVNTSIRTMPLITSDIVLINSNAEVTTALKLRYTQTPIQRSVFDTYR